MQRTNFEYGSPYLATLMYAQVCTFTLLLSLSLSLSLYLSVNIYIYIYIYIYIHIISLIHIYFKISYFAQSIVMSIFAISIGNLPFVTPELCSVFVTLVLLAARETQLNKNSEWIYSQESVP